MLAALGVVYGDIGTSPLYTVHEIFHGSHILELNQANVYGGLSLVFWSLVMVVGVKYVLLIMRADNHGEGGIMALIALIKALALRSSRSKAFLVGLGVFGAALFYGDALITPAISVLSAVEGLEVPAPGLSDFVVPLTLAILTALFMLQRFGTDVVGKLFGPVMVVWFIVIGVLGINQIAQSPSVLAALNPVHGLTFLTDHGFLGFLVLGSVVLAVTGAEALYADMGHFGRPPISRSWFFFVFPALGLNYFGQGALILRDHSTIDSPFFRMAPTWGQIPLVILSALATVIASQAVISGAFSLSWQAVRLGFLPLLEIRHTSRSTQGQVYLPTVNWALFGAIVAIIVGFGSSTALAAAYGLAVTGTFAISTVLVIVIARKIWGLPASLVAPVGAVFLAIDVAFFTANLAKVLHGGWFPLVVAGAIFITLMTWQKGQSVLKAKRSQLEGSLERFIVQLDESEPPLTRVSGTAVFLNANPKNTPLSLKYNVLHNRILHEHVVIFTVETVGRPFVDIDDRFYIDQLVLPDDGVVLIRAQFGFSETPDVPAVLRLAASRGLDIDADSATYFITRSTLTATPSDDMARWRKRLFIAVNRNSATGTRYFNLPEGQVIAMGSTIAI